MKGALCGLLALVFSLTVDAREGRAEDAGPVVVEDFTGPGADKLRQLVVRALAKQKVEMVSQKKVAATEADLGLLSVADNYAAAAKELKAVAFVSGSMSGKGNKTTARLRIKDAAGKTLGTQTWTGRGAPATLKTVSANVSNALTKILAKAQPAAEKTEAVAKAKAEDSKDSKTAAKEAKAEAKKAQEPAEKDEKDDEETSSAATASAGAGSGDDEGISASAKASSSGADMSGLDAALGVHVYSRKFLYNQSVAGGQREYELTAGPAVSFAADYFFSARLGIFVSGEYSVAMFSREKVGTMEYIYRTTSYGFSGGLKARHHIGDTEITGGLGYAKQVFAVKPEANDPRPPQVAGVDYGQVKAGAGLRMPLNDTFALVGSAFYLHLLSYGEIKDAYFPKISGRGGEASAGLAFALPFMQGLEGRATVDVRRYAFSMNAEMGDTRVAGGATDQYAGITFAFGYRPR